jgi:hypothetical protein
VLRFGTVRIRFGEMRIFGRDAAGACVYAAGSATVNVDFLETSESIFAPEEDKIQNRFECRGALSAWQATERSSIHFSSKRILDESSAFLVRYFTASPQASITWKDAQFPSKRVTYGVSSDFQPLYNTHILAGPDSSLQLTIPNSFSSLPELNQEFFFGSDVYHVYAATAFNHSVIIESGGATWDGTNRRVLFDGNIGSGFSFLVLTDNEVAIIQSQGVTFDTP